MIVRKLRLQKGWSQDQLAELAGVSTRTIQRIERGYSPGLETSKALASVFEVGISTFTPEESTMNTDNQSKPVLKLELEEKEVLEYVKGVKEFYNHLVIFAVMTPALLVLAFIGRFGDKAPLILLAALGWGLGVVLHGLIAFEKINLGVFGPKWERKLVEKRLGRKL